MSQTRSLRRSVRGERKKKTGKGWKGNWRDRLTISKDYAMPILLCPGEYDEPREDKIGENDGVPPVNHYFVHPSHAYKQATGNAFRMWRCACGYNGEGDCLGCYRAEHGDKRVGGRRDTFSINALHIGLYEKAAVKDKDGKTVRYSEDTENAKAGDPVMAWQEITKARDKKEALNDIDAKLEEGSVALFRKKYIEVGSGHLDNLMQIDELASKRCACGGELTPTRFSCESCGEVLCDIEDSNMEPKDVLRYSDERQRCPECGHLGFTEAEVMCDECSDPRPLTCFNVVALVRKAGEGTKSTIFVDKIIPLDEYQLPDGSYLLDIDEGGYFVQDEDGNYVLREDAKKLVDNQFDFDRVQRIEDNDTIARFLDCENPFGPSKKDPGSKYRQYRQNQGETTGAKKKATTEDDDDDANPIVKKPAGRKPARRKP